MDVVRKYFAAQDAHNIELAVSCLADDFIFEDVSLGTFIRSKKQFGYVLNTIFGAFPDTRVELKSLFRSGKQAAVEWSFSGTQMSPFAGFRASQKLVTCRGTSVLQLNDALIKGRTDYWDLMTALRNLELVK